MAACWPRGGEEAAQAGVPASPLPPLAEAQHAGRADAAEGAASQPALDCCSNWCFSREFIHHCSPSRKDGIDLKQETFLRRSYSAFLQRLGKELHMPQLTIATAIVFCHRFFIRQSHAKNDRFVIATICMFLAGKVEETPERLNNVIFLSHEIIHSRDPAAAEKIKQKDVYERQKEIMLVGERLVLATLGFELNVHHPYKPLVAAIKKFEVAQSTLSRLAQIAWNFVNDGLQTSLSLQFKPCHVAAGAIFLAAKFLKVKPPVEGEMFWRQEFKITPQQLEDVSNQLLEFYEVSKEEPAFQTSVGANGYDYYVANNYQTSANEAPTAKAQVAEARTTLESQERDQGQHYQDKPATSWPGYEEAHFSELEDASFRKESTMICEGSRTFETSYHWKDEEEWRDKELGNGYYRQLDSKYQYNHSSCVEDDDTRYHVNPSDTYEADLLRRGSQQPAEHALDMRRKDEYQEEIYYGHVNETQDFTYSLSKDVAEPTSSANPWLGYEDKLPRRDWEVLPESCVENGYRDDHLANTHGNVNNRKRSHYTSMDDDDWRSSSKSWINYEEEYPDRGTKNGFRGDSLDNSYRSSYNRGYYHHQYRHERRADTRFDYQRHKMRGWQERDLKRARYEHVN